MRWIALFVFSTVLAATDIAGSSVRTVYVMPMTHGLDQYLANQLIREHMFEVVADPKHADAVFTERLGEPLQYVLEKLHPTPKPPAEKSASKPEDAPKPAATVKSDDASKPEAKTTSAAGADSKPPVAKEVTGGDVAKAVSKDAEDEDLSDTDAKDAADKKKGKQLITEEDAPHPFLSGRDKGTVFLVDAKSRAVLWSVYEKPKKTSPEDMDRIAQRVVTRLKQDLAGK